MISGNALSQFGRNLATTATRGGVAAGFDMDGFLSKHGFALHRRKPWQSHPGGVIFELIQCPFDPDHTNGSAAFTLDEGVPGFGCKHNGCVGRTIKEVFAVYPPARTEAAGEWTPPALLHGELRHVETSLATPTTMNWPAPIDEAAYYGLAGDIVRKLEPQTEADPVAILIHVLVSVGNLGGRSPYFRVGGASHHTNENAICVGKTSSARKGTAKSDTFSLLRPVDPIWAENQVMAGLSSGEDRKSVV